MANTPPPMPTRRRVGYAALLLAGLALAGWFVFAYGSASLVLCSGDCAGGSAMDLLLLGWLVAVVAAGAAPPALLIVRGRWRTALRALGIGGVVVLLYFALAVIGTGLLCR